MSAYQYPKDVASRPGLYNVTGKFCFPKPVSHEGTIGVDYTLVRPLIVGTDVVITASGSDFQLASSVAGEDWGVNAGEYVVFVNTGIDGIYKIKSVDLSNSGNTLVYGPGQSVTTGYVYFLNKFQKITGVGTKFKQALVAGDYIAVFDNDLTATVQARKVVKIVSDTELYIEQGFVEDIGTGMPFLTINKGLIRGVSVKCGGAGVLMEQTVAADDIATFFDENGVAPVYGDSGANTFNVLVQQ